MYHTAEMLRALLRAYAGEPVLFLKWDDGADDRMGEGRLASLTVSRAEEGPRLAQFYCLKQGFNTVLEMLGVTHDQLKEMRNYSSTTAAYLLTVKREGEDFVPHWVH